MSPALLSLRLQEVASAMHSPMHSPLLNLPSPFLSQESFSLLRPTLPPRSCSSASSKLSDLVMPSPIPQMHISSSNPPSRIPRESISQLNPSAKPFSFLPSSDTGADSVLNPSAPAFSFVPKAFKILEPKSGPIDEGDADSFAFVYPSSMLDGQVKAKATATNQSEETLSDHERAPSSPSSSSEIYETALNGASYSNSVASIKKADILQRRHSVSSTSSDKWIGPSEHQCFASRDASISTQPNVKSRRDTFGTNDLLQQDETFRHNPRLSKIWTSGGTDLPNARPKTINTSKDVQDSKLRMRAFKFPSPLQSAQDPTEQSVHNLDASIKTQPTYDNRYATIGRHSARPVGLSEDAFTPQSPQNQIETYSPPKAGRPHLREYVDHTHSVSRSEALSSRPERTNGKASSAPRKRHLRVSLFHKLSDFVECTW